MYCVTCVVPLSVADRGFPVGGGRGPRRGAVDPRDSYVSKILHVKTKESGPVGGGTPGARPPLDPPMLMNWIKWFHQLYLHSNYQHLRFVATYLGRHEVTFITCIEWYRDSYKGLSNRPTRPPWELCQQVNVRWLLHVIVVLISDDHCLKE